MKTRKFLLMVVLIVGTILMWGVISLQVPAEQAETPIPEGLHLVTIPTYVPPSITYQGKLTDAEGQPFAGTVNLTCRVFDAREGGSLLWGPEEHANVPVTDGIFDIKLGASQALTPELLTDTTWLELAINGRNLTTRQSISSVIYAFHANHAVWAEKAALADTASWADGAAHADEAAWADTVDGYHVSGIAPSLDSRYVNDTHDRMKSEYTGPILTLTNLGTGGGLLGITASADASVAAVMGDNDGGGFGVWGRSDGNHGILGESFAQNVAGVYGENLRGYGVWGNGDLCGVYGEGDPGPGVHGKAIWPGEAGVYGENLRGYGVQGEGDASGVYGLSTNGIGVWAVSTNGTGLVGETSAAGIGTAAIEAFNHGAGIGILVSKAGDDGIRITTAGSDGIQIDNVDWSGLFIDQAGTTGVLIKNTGQDGFRVDAAGWDGVYVASAGEDGVQRWRRFWRLGKI